MKHITKLVPIALSVFLLGACGNTGGTDTSEQSSDSAESSTSKASSESTAANGDNVLHISAIPDFDQAELTRNFDDFAAYLSEETGMEVEYVPVVDYSSVVTSFARGDIDLVWFGGLTGVQARSQVPDAEAIAQRPQDAEFQSVFIKQKGLDLNAIEDTKDISFAFGSESSTSGHLMPRYFLSEAGINPEEDFSAEPVYSGSHDRTVELVAAGSAQAGVVNGQYWEKGVADGSIDPEKVEQYYVTPEYYDYNWTIGNVDEKFGAGTKEKIKAAILEATPEDTTIMDLLSADKFIETKNANYDIIKQVATELGIIE